MKRKVLATMLMSCMLVCGLAGCKNEDAAKEETDKKEETVDEEESASGQICSLCEVEKECDTYEVDGQKYVVCDDCYTEFATAFDLEGAAEDVPLTQTCSLCEVEKECGTYEVDGQEYIVCDDCYNEFATAFDLN